MTTRLAQWMEDLDDLINRVPDLYIPDPVKEEVINRLEEIQEEVTEQAELRSVDWNE